MAYRIWLIVVVLLLAGLPRLVAAQDTMDDGEGRYITEIKQRNADYGPGCDGIGVSIPSAVDIPAAIDSEWMASHSACVSGLRLVLVCLADMAGDDRIIGCTLQVADGQADLGFTCEHVTLIAPDARYAPDPDLSALLSQGTGGVARSCAEAGELERGDAVSLAFALPAREPAADVAILLDLDGSEVPAFIVPANQLDALAPST